MFEVDYGLFTKEKYGMFLDYLHIILQIHGGTSMIKTWVQVCPAQSPSAIKHFKILFMEMNYDIRPLC